KARLFDASGTVGDTERKALADFIERSVADVRRRGGPRNSTENHACYRMIISPENSRGLDLRALTKAAVDQLARDAGSGGLPPWIAAEHRNTNHPHVHLIVAGRREVSPGRFRTLLITDPRLDRMKDALAHEMARQREVGARLRATALRAGEARSEPVLHAGPSPEHVGSNASPAEPSRVDFDVVGHRFADPRRPALTQRPRTSARAYGDTPVGSLLQASAALKVARMAGRAARHYQREAEVAGQERGA
ncbi:MAG TPA: hypothetical protein VG245_08690, partial [Candidatus Dormibacteraeota bacterium]|nr:hypothetical protein [Candidatus Dormibacteraeota bacterium]